MKKLEGKVAVVTGASKGIGASVAKHLAAEGASVVVNYSSSKKGADIVVEEITRAGGKAIAIGANVAKRAEIEQLFAQAKNAYGKVDILVNMPDFTISSLWPKLPRNISTSISTSTCSALSSPRRKP
jgi:3-oxoacyl-[acyl-carrier protein] reductase